MRTILSEVKPFRLKSVDVAATDTRRLSPAAVATSDWLHRTIATEMLEPINSSGGRIHTVCHSVTDEFISAYHAARQKRPGLTTDEFSTEYRDNGHDHFSHPLEVISRFQLKHDTNRRFDGRMVWPNLKVIAKSRDRVVVRTQCYVLFRPRPAQTPYQLWGLVMRELLERTDLELMDGRALEIEGFDFPVDDPNAVASDPLGKSNVAEMEAELTAGGHTIERASRGPEVGVAPHRVVRKTR